MENVKCKGSIPDITNPEFNDQTKVLSPGVFSDICENNGVFTEGELEDASAPLVKIAIERLNEKRKRLVWVMTPSLQIALIDREQAHAINSLVKIREEASRAIDVLFGNRS